MKLSTPRTIQSLLRSIVATALTASLGLCRAAGAATAQDKPKLGTVRFVASAPDMTFLPMLLAAELGLDKEAGYTSEITYAASPIGIKAMIAGDFEFSLSVSS